jgi:hypothetical protein
MAHCSLEHSALAENTFYILIVLTLLANGDYYQRAVLGFSVSPYLPVSMNIYGHGVIEMKKAQGYRHLSVGSPRK